MSALDDVLAALVAAFQGVAAGAPVYEGPDPRSISEGADTLIFVGTDGEALVIPDGEDTDGIVVDLEPSEMGPGTWENESGEITCAVWRWSGDDDDMAARRREAEALARACAAAVRADKSLGGVLEAPGEAIVTALRFRLRTTTKGALARVAFTVTYSALLTD